MATERLRVLFSIELDRERLEEYRDELVERGEVLYSEEKIGTTGTIELKHWPGTPEEWESLTDLVDLVDPKVGAIVRTELLEVGEGPAPLELVKPKPKSWRRFLPWLPLFVAIVVALAFAGSGHAATIVGTNGPDTLVGTPHADTIDGRRGSDVLKGRAGNDELLGHRGDDGITAGRGADFVNGGFGHDYITTGRGPDTIITLDGQFDLIHSCGRGFDVVLRDDFDFMAGNCERDL